MSSVVLQMAANLTGWGHWTRMLAIAQQLPQVQIQIYHQLHKVPLPSFIKNVEQVQRLEVDQPIICDRDWNSVWPYQPEDFRCGLCVHRLLSMQPFDPAEYDQVLYLSDQGIQGDFNPVVLETPELNQNFDSHVIASSEIHNTRFLREQYPDYSRRIIYPITAMREQIKHLVGIAGYNLFWECAYYQIPCTLYPSLHRNDSNLRLERLGDQPFPGPFANGAPEVAKAVLDWWLQVI